jgi:hypothetical protein
MSSDTKPVRIREGASECKSETVAIGNPSGRLCHTSIQLGSSSQAALRKSPKSCRICRGGWIGIKLVLSAFKIP